MPTRTSPAKPGSRMKVVISKGPAPGYTKQSPKGSAKPAIGKAPAGPAQLSNGTPKPPPPSAGKQPLARRTTGKLQFLKNQALRILQNPNATEEDKAQAQELVDQEQAKVDSSADDSRARLGEMALEEELRKQQSKKYAQDKKALMAELAAGHR